MTADTVAKSALDRPAVQLRPGSVNTISHGINLEHFVQPNPEHQYPLYQNRSHGQHRQGGNSNRAPHE